MAGRKKKSAGRMPLWLYVLIVVAIALVTYFRTSGEAEAGDPQPPAASAAAQQTPADETLTVRFLDVEQGDSILLACGDETMLIDGGPVEEGQFLVSRLNRLDVAKLTYVINTHPDEDHCGGLAAVLAKYPAEHVYSSVTEYTTKVFSNVVKYADEQGHRLAGFPAGDGLPGHIDLLRQLVLRQAFFRAELQDHIFCIHKKSPQIQITTPACRAQATRSCGGQLTLCFGKVHDGP